MPPTFFALKTIFDFKKLFQNIDLKAIHDFKTILKMAIPVIITTKKGCKTGVIAWNSIEKNWDGVSLNGERKKRYGSINWRVI